MSEEDKKEVVPNPALTPPVEIKPPEINKDDLLSKLTEMGVSKAEDLMNLKATASQVGQIGRVLGDVRKENEELKKMVYHLQQSTNAGYQQPDAQPIDLGKVVEERVEAVFDRKTRQQLQAQEQIQAEIADIEADSKFLALKEVFQQHIGSRVTQQRFRNGETTITKEYMRLKDVWMDKMLEAHTNALKLTQTSVKAPHVEEGSTHSPQLPAAASEAQKRLRQTVDARSKGQMTSDQAMEDMVKTLFPAEMFKI